MSGAPEVGPIAVGPTRSREDLGTGLWGPATAVPPYPVNQSQTRRFLACSGGLSARRVAWLEGVLEHAAVHRRHTCVPEFHNSLEEGGVTASGRGDWESVLGGLSGRMGRYREVAADLGAQAARGALAAAGSRPQQVTHLVWVTCTGFENPGPDLVVADRLGLPDTVHRVQVGFMGCQASVQGLRLADAICRSEPEAVVLLVCVELCTLHFDPTRSDPEHLVVCSLFSDGAAAALLSRRSFASPPLLRLREFASRRVTSGAGLLTWKLGEPTFRMGLGRRLPEVVAREVGGFAAGLLPSRYRVNDLDWAVHPGGRAVLDAVDAALELEPTRLAPSRAVLADYGNMSSPTLLFVLGRGARAGREGVALAFGPGLSLEGFGWVGDAGAAPPA